MTEHELQQYLLREFPQENTRCEWKEFKNLKNSFCGDEKDDVISYVSAIANMEGGFLVVGVHDKTLEIVGTDTYKPEFGIRNTFKKLVISIIFSIFVVENQYIINKEYYHYGDYQRQNYRNFLYYR